MKTPVLVFESYDLHVCRSAEQASGHLEIVDVEDGIFDAHDSEGYLLDIVIQLVEVERRFLYAHWKEGRRVIRIRDHTPRENHGEDVRLRRIRFLGGWRHKTQPFEGLSMEELIAKAGKQMPWKMGSREADPS